MSAGGCRPLVLPYEGVLPALAGPPAACGRDASLLGRLKAGRDLVVGRGAVVRADGHRVRIGDGVALGTMATVHIAHGRLPAVIGHRVTVGRNAVVHACTVGDDVVVGEDVVILDGSVVGDGAVIEPGSTVFPRSVLEAGRIHAGSPARDVGPVGAEARGQRARTLRAAIAADMEAAEAIGAGDAALAADAFVAATARVSGRLEMAAGSSLFFGCVVRAGGNAVRIGEGSNVQDNTVLDASGGDVVIGAETTIGHNVLLAACRVGPRSLVGIGARLAPGTEVEEDVLVAAGTATEPGQRLEAGWLWAGRPARRLSPMDAGRRAMLAGTIAHYRDYAAAFRAAQRDHAPVA